jgi:hypothetical protein
MERQYGIGKAVDFKEGSILSSGAVVERYELGVSGCNCHFLAGGGCLRGCHVVVGGRYGVDEKMNGGNFTYIQSALWCGKFQVHSPRNARLILAFIGGNSDAFRPLPS